MSSATNSWGKKKISQHFPRPESYQPLPSLCQTFVGKVMVKPLNFGVYTQSLCFFPRDSGLCIPGRELNPVSGCRGMSRTLQSSSSPRAGGEIIYQEPSLTLRTGLKDKL